MPGSSAGNLKKWLSICLIILAAIVLFFSWLPFLAEKFLLPEILPSQVLADYRVSVYRLGLRGCILKVSALAERNPIIATTDIRIKWSLSSLMDRRIDLLVLDGLQIKKNDQAQSQISSFSSSPAKSADTIDQPENGSGGFRSPLLIDRIQVLNSTVTFEHQNRDHTLPVVVTGQRIGVENLQGKKDSLHYKFLVSIAAQEMAAELTYEHQNQMLSGNIKTIINLDRVTRELKDFLPPSLKMTGIAEITLHAESKLAPFSLKQLQADARLENMRVRNKEVLLLGNGDNPVLLSLSGSHQKLLFEATGLAVKSPLKATTHFDAVVAFPDNTVQWQGNLQIQPVAGQKLARQYILSQAPPIVLQHEGIYMDSEMQLTISSFHQEDSPSELFVVDHNNIQLQAGRLGIESEWFYTPKNVNNKLSSTLLFKGHDLTLGSAGVVLQVPRLQLDGKGIFGRHENNNGFEFSGGLDVADGSLKIDRQELNLHGIQIQFPASWPVIPDQKKGIVKIDNISLRTIDLGYLNASLNQGSDKIGINGKLNSSLIPDGKIIFNGALHMPDSINSLAEFSFSAPDTHISPESFSPFFPAMESLSGSGLLNMEGQVTVYQDRTDGFLALGIHDGNVEMPEVQTTVEGINIKVDFPDLPSLHTSPQQKISIDRITSKKLLVTDIMSSFQLESSESLFVEKISADWSGGRVFASSFRLQKEKPDFEAALLCDRLNLGGVLTQLGLAQAEGNGTVSGRIPLLYEEGNFFVDDGFLFSTPGETGTLKIIKSEHLAAGIPQDVPHFSPIHFAGAALQDFQYNWAKLLISSEDENLLLKLQIDGKPREVLPYRFDTKQNVFVRLAEGEVGGIDQPIKLDVNFNVPLNELLRYHKQMQPILRNIR